MPVIQGTVQYLKVGDDFCVTRIKEDGTGVLETCAIWYCFPSDPKPSASTRSIQGLQFELLRTSLVKGLPVAIQWDGDTGLPQNIKLLAAP